MGLIRYSCGHILGHHEPGSCQIWCVEVFHHALLKYEKKTWKCWNAIFFFIDDVTLWYSIQELVEGFLAAAANTNSTAANTT